VIGLCPSQPGPDPAATGTVDVATLDAKAIARLIDHTLLRPEATAAEVRRVCGEARERDFAAVCVNPAWVRLAARELRGRPTVVASVAGFPLGASVPEIKAAEARRAVEDGAREVDMVLCVGALKAGDHRAAVDDVTTVVAACRASGARVKVIIEAALLTDDEKVRACAIARLAGAHFVKTSTGFGPAGATAADVALMRRVVGHGVGVKAAGGVRDWGSARAMIAAGANRIGTSSGVTILDEARAHESPVTGARGVD
jgi:deoxyribose-phosphate aldolase